MINIFTNSKYTNWYEQIILNSKQRIDPNGYTEKHHIIPKSLGGNNTKENIAVLTFKEHFICHRLLVKMVTGHNKTKMAYSFRAFCGTTKDENQKLTSGQHAKARKILVDNLKKQQLGKTFDERFGVKKSNKIKKLKRKTMKARREREKKHGIGNPNVKIWFLTDPMGTKHIVTVGLKNWCQEHNLNYAEFRKLYYNGNPRKKNSTDGWKITQKSS